MRTLLWLALAALAGCMGTPSDTHFTVAEDAASFQDSHTGDGYDLRVRVTDHNGTPIEGAAVVWFTGGDGLVGFAGSGSIGPSGATGEGHAIIAFGKSGAEMVAGGRTGPDGIATADLKPGRSVHVAAGGLAGQTTEVRFNVAVGGGGESGTVTVPLYPERIALSQPVRMGNHLGLAGHVGQPATESWPLVLAQDPTLDAELRGRLHTLQLDATWENKVGEGADLYVGLGPEPASPRWVGEDHQQYVVDGRHTETLFVEGFDDVRSDVAQRGLHAILMTDWISGGMDGVPVQLDGEAMLKGSNIVID